MVSGKASGDAERAGARLVAALVSVLLLGCPVAARAQCESIPDTPTHVYVITPDSQLDVMERDDSSGSDTPHSFIAIDNVFDAQILIDPAAVRKGSAFCPAPRRVAIGLGFIKRQVLLPAAGFRDLCVRTVLIKHAAEHLAAEDRALEFLGAATSREFRGLLEGLKTKPALTAEEAQYSLDRGATEIINAARDRMDVAVRQASAAVDTAEVLTALRQSCNGRLMRIEHHEKDRL